MLTLSYVISTGLLVALAGCSDSGELFESLADRGEGTSRTRLYDSWQTLLTTASCGDVGEDGIDLAVEAKVLDINEGVGLRWTFDENGENSRKTLTAFDDASAEVRTVHFSLFVDRFIGGNEKVSPGDELQIGLAVSPNVSIDEARRGLENASPAIFFLETSPVFDYEPGLFSISEDGLLVAVPDDDGQLTFPSLTAEDVVQPPKGTTLREAQTTDCPVSG